MSNLENVRTPLAPVIGPAASEGTGGLRERPMSGHTAASNEAALLQALKGGSALRGYSPLPDQKAATLVQPAGREWREIVKGPLRIWGSWLILGMLGALIVFYVMRGKIEISAGPSGRTLERFSLIERFVHWLTASSFIALALSGLNITYGRYVLLPIMPAEWFTALSLTLKYIHNFVAFPFMLGLALTFAIWIVHNIPSRIDLQWLAVFGGLFTKDLHPPAGKFNAGQKLVFWSVVIGGGALAVSGIYLLFPFYLGDMGMQQLMQVVHAAVAVVMIAIVLAHIYIGSLGMEGAFDAMGTGRVDENWAREHHSLWVAEVKGDAAARPGHD
ncbi:MAG: formate dehydrogenase subunit gamma [Alphaproteobacteria bacterium]|nr:formate dehydrogenase subunit gamma [Alphaproteobacteria bacterium]